MQAGCGVPRGGGWPVVMLHRVVVWSKGKRETRRKMGAVVGHWLGEEATVGSTVGASASEGRRRAGQRVVRQEGEGREKKERREKKKKKKK